MVLVAKDIKLKNLDYKTGVQNENLIVNSCSCVGRKGVSSVGHHLKIDTEF